MGACDRLSGPAPYNAVSGRECRGNVRSPRNEYARTPGSFCRRGFSYVLSEPVVLGALHEGLPLAGREEQCSSLTVLRVTDRRDTGRVSDFDAVLLLGVAGRAP